MAATRLSARMGEMQVSGEDGAEIVAVGLGSCVGLALVDVAHRVAGVAHVVLPSAAPGSAGIPAKFADTAVPALVDALLGLGANRRTLQAVLVGGAQMFAAEGHMDVGARNESALRDALEQHRIPVRAAQTRGHVGRTLCVHVGTSRVTARAAGGVPIDLIGRSA